MTIRSVALVCVGLPTMLPPAAAQTGFVGAGVERLLSGSSGIDGGCAEPSTRTGVAIQAGRSVVGRALAVVVGARFHLWSSPAQCLNGIPEPTGVQIIRDRRNLLSHRYVATDLQARVTAPAGPMIPSLSVGLGTAWRAENDVPYMLLGGGVAVAVGPFKAGLRGELVRVRVRFDVTEIIWLNGQPISVRPLGSQHDWNSAASLGLLLEAPAPW